MSDERSSDSMEGAEVSRKRSSWVLVVALALLIALLGGLLVVELTASPLNGRLADSGTPDATATDAVSSYRAAVATGKPVYVLFHSLS